MAHLCARLGERAHAATLLSLLEPYTNQIETSAATAFYSTSSCAGILAALLRRDDEADRYFTQAIELTEPDRARPLLEESARPCPQAQLRQHRTRRTTT